jgi:hypothetical protein
MISRSQVVDLGARKLMRCTVTVIDRERLARSWESAPE